jgi:uncharacterized membrane protein
MPVPSGEQSEEIAKDWRRGAIAEDQSAPQDGEGGMRGELAVQSRRLRNSIISLAVFFALVIGLLFAVPGLDEAADRITDASMPWIGAGIAFELLSCLGYVLLFELVFAASARGCRCRSWRSTRWYR